MATTLVRGWVWLQLLVGCLLMAAALLMLAGGAVGPWLPALLAGAMFTLSWLADAMRHQGSRAAEPLRIASFASGVAFVLLTLPLP